MEDNKISTECWFDPQSWALPLRITFHKTVCNYRGRTEYLYFLDIQFLCFGVRFEGWVK